MDPRVKNSITDDNNSEEQQSQTELTVRPTLSQVKKSWGFRRTTIARREFMEEVGDLTHSPPIVRRGRSRRTNQTPQTTTDTCTNQRPCATRSVIDDLEWSAPSSPVSEESKSASEASAGGTLDPSLWQDFGSAFHTAFSLLGGNEGLTALKAPDILEATNTVETLPSQAIDENDVSDIMESAEDMNISLPVAPADVNRGEIEDVVLISSQEEDSDEMTLIQIKEQLVSKGRQRDVKARGGKAGRGKARGRGRGRRRAGVKGRGRGRGRGRAVELQSCIADGEESDDEVMVVNSAEQQLEQLQEMEKENYSHTPAAIQISPPHSDSTLSPAQHSNSDCIIIDTELDQITDLTPGQYDDAPEEEEQDKKKKKKKKKKDNKNVGECLSISDTEGYDANALYCICRQKHNKRFMICCDSCQEWFHGDCVGISDMQGRKMEKKGQEYICPPCTTKKELQSKPHPQPEPEISFPECMTLISSEEGEGDQQSLKETVEEEEEEASVIRPEPESEAEMETHNSPQLCIGPGCSKHALPDSGYCGTDCILQHAAVTMKTLSGPKMPKPRGRAQRKNVTARPITRGQRSGRTSKRLAGKAEEEGEEKEKKEDDQGHMEAASSLACDPSLTEVQGPSIPSSQFYTASKKDIEEGVAHSEAQTPTQSSENMATDADDPSFQHVTEQAPPQTDSEEKAKEPENSGVLKQQSAESGPPTPTIPAKSVPSPAAQSPSTSAVRHHQTGVLIVNKTSYVIPKKQAGPQSPSKSHISASVSCQKPSSAPTLLSETRNLLVPPAPSAPSSRPSQPNNQVRQSIQRSLTSILLKRVCDCDDLDMSESEVAKLVASIEMEMFDIFRNTDSKYMNKYRTIMFNLKDPRNKGLLYRVVRGEISPFRLVRMTQKDMQATKAPEPSAKETEGKDAAAKATSLPQNPEAVKIELPSLNPTRPERKPDKRPCSTVASHEQKRSLPAPALKTRINQPSQGSAIPDILTSMLKDTTSEHKAHLFDLKCKICTGQIQAGAEDEPPKKKHKVSETRDKHEPSWRQSAGDDSPLRAPPDSPDMDSPTSSLMDPTSRLIIDPPALTIVESPASPTMDSPASPILESPASPVMENPTSPTEDTPTATKPKRAYTPVMIPAVSTVTITRRDPRTAANRFSALSVSTAHYQPTPYASLQETSSALPTAPVSSLPPMKPLPKSILMKPSSSADPRLYSASSRTLISESPADGDTVQFLAKQEILWKGFLNMLNVAKFVTKGYLVSGSADNLKADLPDTIQIGGRIMPQTVWDYVAKLKTSVTKELCVIRFYPATEEEEVAYVSLFSYFSSRGRFGVVANTSHSIKDIYLVPLSAKESVPSILQPLEGPGLEKNRPNLLLGLAIIQKGKRPGSLSQEVEEKRPNVHISKDPMWIPKPPVLYGSDKLESFQPYDPETPASTSPPGSPLCPGSPSDSFSSGSVIIPSLLTSLRATPPVSTSVVATTTQSICNSLSENNPTASSSDKTPLQTILKTLFGNKQSDTTVSSDGGSTATTASDKKTPVFSQVPRSMVDPIVQQYGQKSKVKEIEQEENDFDRPYDPEEEYNPATGYGMVAAQNVEKNKADGPALSDFVDDDDVAYDPEDETIFKDIQSVVSKPPFPSQTSESSSCPAPLSTQVVAPAAPSTSAEPSAPSTIMPNLPTGSVVVSAATLTEQQRMLEELNKQIEEQKRQLKEQEEALRQQREAVGMFMAHFSVSDSLMSPPTKSLPLGQLSSKTTDKTSHPTESMDKSNVDSQTVKQEDTTATVNLKEDTDIATEKDEIQEDVKESDKYSSAGEIEDSDVAYDPEDESLFNEIQEDVFQGSSIKTNDSSLSRAGQSDGGSPNSHHSRKRRLSPKRRSHRERDHHRSSSKRSQQRSPSHSRRHRERDRHRRSERDRSRHRTRDQSERQARHRKEHIARRHSRGHRRSPSSPTKKRSVSFSPSPQVLEESKQESVPYNAANVVTGQFLESNTLSSTPVTIKNDPDGHMLKCNIVESPNKDLPPCSHGHPHNVKLEISELPKSHKVPHDSVSDQDDKGSGTFTQLDKPSQQEILLRDTIESTVPLREIDPPIPLREIDPPIRDSPESPDPDPQFVKPSSTEKSDCVDTEENRDPEAHISVSVPFCKIENDCLAIGGQATVSNILWPTFESPVSDVTKLDFRTLDLKDPGFRDQGMIEVDKQAEGQCAGLKHPKMMVQVGSNLESATGLAIQNSRPEIDHVANCPGPGMSGTSIMNSEPPIKEPVHRGPLTGISSPGSDMKVPSMQGMTPSIWGHGPHIQGTAMHSSDTNMREPGIQYLKTNRTGLGPVTRGSGMRTAMQDTEISNMQGMDPGVHGPDLIRSKQEITEQKVVPVVTVPQLKIPDSRPGVREVGEDQSFGSPQIEDRAPDFMGRGRGHNNRGECANTAGMRSCMRGRGVRGPSPGPYFGGPGRVQRQSLTNDSPVLEESGPQERGFQQHGGNRDVGNKRSLDTNASICSEGSIVRADEQWDSQRGQGVSIRGPRPNINYESGGSKVSCIAHAKNETKVHFRDPQTNTRAESVHGPDRSNSETMHEFRRQEGRSYLGSGQDMDRMGVSHKRGDRTESNARSTGIDIGKTGANRRDADIQGRNIQGPGSEWRNEQIGHEHRGPMPNIKNLDGRGLETGGNGPDMRGQRSQNIDQDPHRRDLDWCGPVSDIRDDWRGIERRGSGTVRGRPFMQNKWGVHLSDRGELNRENLGPNKGPGGGELLATGPVMNVPVHDKGGPGGPDFRRPEPEKKLTMDNLGPGIKGPGVERTGLAMDGPDWRGPEGPHFKGPERERMGPGMEGQRHDIRGPPGPHFTRPWPENRGPDMAGPGLERGGSGGQDFWGPGLERSSQAMEGPGIDRRGLLCPDFRGPGSENRDSSREGPGPDRGGPGGPDFRGPGADRRHSSMEFPGNDKRGLGGPHIWGQGPESRDQSMECPGPGSRGPRDAGFSGPGPERRGTSMGPAGPERGRPEGPDFSGPVSDRRGPAMDCIGPERRESGVPDFKGSVHEGRGPSMVIQESDKRGSGGPDFWGLGHQNRGLCIDRSGPELDRRGPAVSELRGPRCERRGPPFQGQEHNRRGPGDQNTSGMDPDSRRSYMGGPGPECIGLGPERTGPGIYGPGPGPSRGQRGPHFQGPGPESGHPTMEGPGPGRRGPEIRGPWLEGPGMESLGPIGRGPGGQNFMGQGAEHQPSNFGDTENHSFLKGTQFGSSELEKRPLDMEGPEPGRRGPHFIQVDHRRSAVDSQRKDPRGPGFRGPGCETRGPDNVDSRLNRQESGGSGFREPGPERRGPYIDGPKPDWRKSSCPDLRGPHIRQKCQNTEGPSHDSRVDWGVSDFKGPEPIQEMPNVEEPGPERTGQPLRGPRPIRRNRPGTDRSSLNRGDRWKGAGTEDPWSDRIGPGVNETQSLGDEWKTHVNRGPNEQGQDHRRQDIHGEWRGPGSRGPGPTQERSDGLFPGPMTGAGDNWGGPGDRGSGRVQDNTDMVCLGPSRGGPGHEWREPNRAGCGSNRRGRGPFFTGERDSDNEGQAPGVRGSDMRRGPDIGNDWRQPDLRGNVKGKNKGGPGGYRGVPSLKSCPNGREFEMEGLDKRGPGGLDLRHRGPGNRNSNIESPGTDGRFSDCGGLGTEWQSLDMESRRPGRQGFEYDFRRERRGPDIRKPGPDKSSNIRHGPGSWDANTEVPGSDTRGPTMTGPGLESRESEPSMNSEMQASYIRGPGYVNREPDLRDREPGQRGQTTSNERRGPAFRHLNKSAHLNNPQQVTRFKGPSHPHSVPVNRPPAPTPHSGVKSCPGFENLQNQQALKPQRHRGALLPTPTEGLIRFPNRMINNPDVFSLKQKQLSHSTDREWRRGRVSREGDLVKGQRQEQEKSLAGNIHTSVDASTTGGEERKTDK